MNCERFREKLLAFVRGELSDEERQEMEKHLHECPACRVEYEEELRIEKILKSVKRVSPPPELRFEILRSIAKKEAQKRRIRSILRLAPAIAAIVLILLTVYFVKKTKPAELEAATFQVDLLSPKDKGAYLPDEVRVLAAVYPERSYKFRVYLDGEDVTDEAQKVDGTIIYVPNELEEGYHKVVVEVREPVTGAKVELDRVFYCFGGEQ